MATLATLRSQVRTEVGVGSSDAQVDQWINERYKEAVARSEWRRAIINLGPTVAGTASYTLPTNVVRILAGLQIGTAEYHPIGQSDLWGAQSGRLHITPAWRLSYTSTGTRQIILDDPPDTSGDAINALVALLPDTLTANDSPIFPEDLHPGLVDGAAATGLSRYAEQRSAAEWHEARFREMIQELKRRASTMGQPTGPVQVGVFGYHFV